MEITKIWIFCLWALASSVTFCTCEEDEFLSTFEDDLMTTTEYMDPIFDRKNELHKAKAFVKEWLFSASESSSSLTEYESYDGWYNNPSQPSLGSTDSALIRLLPSAYEDGVKEPVKRLKSANPFNVSDAILGEMESCGKDDEMFSKSGNNAIMVFFGQFVVEEILNARRPSCPPEHFNIEIPSNHDYNVTKVKEMPFVRTRHDKKSGKSTNNPRKQINSATAWIDGSVIYGTTRAWADSMRSFKRGCLATSDKEALYPTFNNGYLSYLNPAADYQDSLKKRKNFRIGNTLAHENPFVLTFNIIFFRWHNLLANTICGNEKNSAVNDTYCYNEARKWVTATLQHIIVDEWLPNLLGEKLEDYTLYDPSVDPTISNSFQSAAMRFGHTLVPAGVYVRIPDQCKTSVIRLCDSYYDSLKTVTNHSIEDLLLGMAFQAAEKGDPVIVEDLRRSMHGPPEFTRSDLMAINIQRGRDHGLPGYGVAREYLIEEKDHGLLDMASKFNPAYTKVINRLKDFYDTVSEVDLWVGGLLETDDGLGPVFKAIIRDQFQRIRDADRFWFENKQNGLFSDSEIEVIKSITMRDIILAVTKNIDVFSLQKNVFSLPVFEEKIYLACHDQLVRHDCHLLGENKDCFALLPVKDESLNCASTTSVQMCSKSEPETYDYFTGSAVSYVLSFLFLFLFIVGCGVTLLLLVKKRQNENSRKRQSVKRQRKGHSNENSCLVTEWVGRKEGTREITVQFLVELKMLSICLLSKQTLRSIDMKHVQMIELQVSVGGHSHYILIRIAREYDIVLKFESDDERTAFIDKFEAFLGNIGVGRQRYEMNIAHLFKTAVTKADRQIQLEKFFRVVFAQAFSIKHDQDELLNMDSTQAKEIINVELTAYEFAEALSLRPDALFVSQMFALIDADGNGYISFREFLNVIIIFAKGSPEDKTKLMFDMYDIDHSGKLSRLEFSSMIRSLLELANQSLSSAQLDHLITSMFKSAGLQNKQEIAFQDFSHLLADHREELGYVQLSFDVGGGYKAAPQAVRQSMAGRAQETVLRAYSIVGGDNISRPERGKSYIRVETKPAVYEKDPTKQKVNRFIRFIENYRLHIFWTSLYTLIILGIFIDKAYYYSVEAEHTGLRRIAGYGLTVTRGAASSMMFAFSTILLTMCRNTITLLRETFLHKYIPFDAAISFHKYIAFWALAFTAVHAIGHGINFYHLSTQTFYDLQCLMPNYHLDPQNPPKFHYWLFQTITGITGVMLVCILTLMYVFAMQFARRHVFNAFWKTHNLYPLLYILMILHGIGHLIQAPIFYYFFLGPCVLFTVDRLISVSRKKVEISVIKAELLPSGVTHLEFIRPANFEYRSGQWVRIACVPLNTNEYHPFTLSSAPHEENLSLHIRAVGPWTTNLRKVYDPNNLQQHAYPKIYLDGPYGEGHQDWFKYDVSVLVGGGIGITPFASILKDIVFKSSMKNKIFCKKLYFIWVTRSQKQFEWMIDIIQEVEESDKNGLVDVHIFITQFYQKFDLRTTMLYICERHFQKVCGRSLFTGLRSTTHFGRPDFEVFLNSLREQHSDVSKIAVFSCGPPLMTHGVQLSCEELNKHEGAIFVHHFENF